MRALETGDISRVATPFFKGGYTFPRVSGHVNLLSMFLSAAMGNRRPLIVLMEEHRPLCSTRCSMFYVLMEKQPVSAASYYDTALLAHKLKTENFNSGRSCY